MFFFHVAVLTYNPLHTEKGFCLILWPLTSQFQRDLYPTIACCWCQHIQRKVICSCGFGLPIDERFCFAAKYDQIVVSYTLYIPSQGKSHDEWQAQMDWFQDVTSWPQSSCQSMTNLEGHLRITYVNNVKFQFLLILH